jgi:photosystem II stability/assembly factor-like uncharacterized protein
MMKNRCKLAVAVFCVALLSTAASPLTAQESGAKENRTPLPVDFIGADYLKGLDGIAVAGLYGMVGLLQFNDGVWKLKRVENPPKEDFTALARYTDDTALVGSSSGRIYLYDGKSLTELAHLSEYDEPVLDIVAVDGRAWAVGARGMVAKSTDGKEWEILEIRDVKQPTIVFQEGRPADWYFGVSNLNMDSIKFVATVGGEPAIEDEHYILFADEGFIQNTVEFDMDVPPTIEFTFNPGPPFRAGDVSWNTVLYDGSKLTIAGEFGMVFQSEDEGETWVRRDTKVVEGEPSPAYWLTGVQQGSTLHLAGAAGVSSMSEDGGVSWVPQPRPGNEGIFGISLLDNGQPLIAGAVGLIGTYDGSGWKLADRTRLKLLSWLKNPVELEDGSILVLGGRSTAISYQDGTWTRIPVDVSQ